MKVAAAPELEGIGGRYYGELKPTSSSIASYDEILAERVWEFSAELCGLQAQAGHMGGGGGTSSSD